MSLDRDAIRARADPTPPYILTDQAQVIWLAGFAAARSDVPALLDALDRLAREVWSGVQRCYDDEPPLCDRCRAALALLSELGYDEAMAEWGS